MYKFLILAVVIVCCLVVTVTACRREQPAQTTNYKQPSSEGDTPWRSHPSLEGRFPPDYPDDTQVLVHDGGPRITQHHAELVWVRVSAVHADIFQGQILNTPHQLESVRQNDIITFIVPKTSQYSIMVTQKYLSERPKWTCHPCDKCGFDELFDAPSDLIAVIFPDMPKNAKMEWFTSFCPLCGGVQVLELKKK
jgi:hypothetical protein